MTICPKFKFLLKITPDAPDPEAVTVWPTLNFVAKGSLTVMVVLG